MQETYRGGLDTTMSILQLFRRKCTLAASRAAPWWVTLIMRCTTN